MKIALVILHADPARGGAERYTIDLATALAHRGEAVSLIASSFAQVPAGVTDVRLAATGMTRTSRYRSFLDCLDAHLATAKYDVVHAMLPVRRCDVYHPHAGMAVGAIEKSTWLDRLFNSRRVQFANVERGLLLSENPPVVLCLSEYVKRDVRRLYPNLAQAKLRTLFNAVDLERFDPSKPFAVSAGREDLVYDPDRTIALMIAQDFYRKGLRETLEALAQIDPPQRPALVVRGKEGTTLYSRLVRGMRLDRDVFFRGPTFYPEREYRKCDFFILPTKHDPCSLVVLESLAMGVPVISTVCNGATEIMTDGVHGFILQDPRNTRDIADAIHKMLDPATRNRMSQACLELRPQLAYDRHVDRLLEIYRTLPRLP